MTLTCDGIQYLNDDMLAFPTPDPSVPRVMITRDCRAVFVLSLGEDGRLRAHRAGTPEIISIARRYGIKDLLNAFPAKSASAEIADTEARGNWGSI